MTALDECRAAWRALHPAERTIQRLNAYKRLTPAMRTDLHAAEARARECRATLERILGGPAR